MTALGRTPPTDLLQSDGVHKGETGRILLLQREAGESWKVLWDLIIWPFGC